MDRYSEEEELEQIKLAVASARLKGNGFLTTENLNSELQDRLGEDVEAEKIGSNWYYKGHIIEENGNVEKYNSILPKEYQQVEYIESTGTEYIDTGIVPTSGFGFWIDVQVMVDNTSTIMGTSVNNGGAWGGFAISTYKSTTGGQLSWFREPGWNNFYNPGFSSYTSRCQISDINNILTNGLGEIYETPIYTEANIYGSLYLFKIHSTKSGTNRQTRLYGCKLYKNGEELERNFIPCYSTTTVTDVDEIERPKDTIGLYDTVEGKFYVNKGTGTFLKGADV